VFRGATLLAVLTLAGCATPPAAMPDANALSGRLSLQVDAQQDRPAQSVSAAFDMRGGADRGELRLSTPLGTTLAAAFWGPGEGRKTLCRPGRTFARGLRRGPAAACAARLAARTPLARRA
jgi:hypothetical protein